MQLYGSKRNLHDDLFRDRALTRKNAIARKKSKKSAHRHGRRTAKYALRNTISRSDV